jgi:hypothetical protein
MVVQAVALYVEPWVLGLLALEYLGKEIMAALLVLVALTTVLVLAVVQEP